MYQYANKSIIFSLSKQIKKWLLAAALLILVSMNIATLINDSFHTAAFAALSTALGYTLTDKMLSRSPTVNRKNDVASATKELNRQNKSLKKQSANLQKKIDKRSVALKKFSQRTAARLAIAATRKITSISGEAVPILGIAVIAGVTAWNIHDSCQMMKELDELNDEFELQLEEKQTVCGIEVTTKKEILAEMRESWLITYKKAKAAINHAAGEMPDWTVLK